MTCVSIVAPIYREGDSQLLSAHSRAFLDNLAYHYPKQAFELEVILIDSHREDDFLIQVVKDRFPARVLVLEKADRALGLHKQLNIGIKQARGDFILVTSGLCLFSEELWLRLADSREQQFARVDRYDLAEGLSLEGGARALLEVVEQESRCLHAVEGSFALNEQGFRDSFYNDIAASHTNIYFGRGVSPLVEHEFSGISVRWARSGAELILARTPALPTRLMLELSAGPGVQFKAFELEVWNPLTEQSQSFEVSGRTRCDVSVPAVGEGHRRLLLKTKGGFQGANAVLVWDFCLHKVDWLGEKDDIEFQSPSFFDRGLERWRRFQLRGAGRGVANYPPPLHINKAADFILMSRDDWRACRGFSERDASPHYSDQLLCYQAQQLGLTEVVWKDCPLYRLLASCDPFSVDDAKGGSGKEAFHRSLREMKQSGACTASNPGDWGLDQSETFLKKDDVN